MYSTGIATVCGYKVRQFLGLGFPIPYSQVCGYKVCFWHPRHSLRSTYAGSFMFDCLFLDCAESLSKVVGTHVVLDCK